MRILIVTIFNSLNYGAYLQGYGLYQVFNDMGHDVKMYVADPHDFKFYVHALHLRKPKDVIYNARLLHSFYHSWSKMNRTCTLDQEYDVAIIGSDELWNVHNVNFEHSEIYIGKRIQAKKICTYAVSGNNTTASEFVSVYGENPLRYIDRIAVRDSCTRDLTKSITGIEPTIVVDPTLLYDFKIIRNTPTEKYLVVYGYYFEEEERTAILSYAHESGVKLVSAGFVHRWCDKIFTGPPLKFLSLINNAEGIISATFHGTILSMKYNKNLAVFHHGSQKIIDVLSRYSMLGCVITKKNNIADCFRSSSDYTCFNNRLKDEVNISKRYIEDLLIK